VSDPPRSPGLPRVEKSLPGTQNTCVRTGSPCSLPTRWCQIKRARMCNGRSEKSKIDVRLLLVDSRCPAWRLVAVFRCPPPPKNRPDIVVGSFDSTRSRNLVTSGGVCDDPAISHQQQPGGRMSWNQRSCTVEQRLEPLER
jgi:hypothetical protein